MGVLGIFLIEYVLDGRIQGVNVEVFQDAVVDFDQLIELVRFSIGEDFS